MSEEKRPRVFLTRAGAAGEDEELALEKGLAVVGFEEIPSLEEVKRYEDVFALVAKARQDLKPRAVGNYAGQLWSFVSMSEGDVAVLPRKTTAQIALGKVAGPYRYKRIDGKLRHSRVVDWIRPDVPRSVFEQDLLYSFGAFMTVCRITRNDAERRVVSVMAGKNDPGPVDASARASQQPHEVTDISAAGAVNLTQLAHDQIVAHIQSRFAGHALSRLVEAVLRVDGWVTKASSPGPDGGVDVLAGRGPLGLDEPRLCVQVKSQTTPVDVTVLRGLQGSMQTFGARQGLLVAWGGFNKAVQAESRQSYFSVRLWDSKELVEAVYRTYERLPAEIQAELPLKRTWMLVIEDLAE